MNRYIPALTLRILLCIACLALPLYTVAAQADEVTIGVVYPHLDETYEENGVQYQIFFHMEKNQWDILSKERGFIVEHRVFDTAEMQLMSIDDLKSRGVDALVLNYTDRQTAEKLAQKASEAGIPAIAHGVRPLEGLGIPVIAYDNYEAGRAAGVAAAEVFEAQNPQTPARIFLVTGNTEEDYLEERIEGFVEGVTEVLPGATVLGRSYNNGTTASARKELMNDMSSWKRANIFFAANDFQGMGVLNAVLTTIGELESTVIASAGGSELSMSVIQPSLSDPWVIVSAFDTESYVRQAYEMIEEMLKGTEMLTGEGAGSADVVLTKPDIFKKPTLERIRAYVTRNYGYEDWDPYCGIIVEKTQMHNLHIP